jgi:tRNA1(Val) A37 N6-methylase TrmN6
MDALLLLQVPPVPVVVKVADVPAHNGDAPLMVPASGALLTVTALVAVAVPQLLVTA